MSSSFINHNGALFPAGQALLTADNRGFRYGDGLFETMLVRGDKSAAGKGVRLGGYHFERLGSGLRALRFGPAPFSWETLSTQILDLCAAHDGNGANYRVRLVVFRGDGALSDPPDPVPQYIIQAAPLPADFVQWREEGMKLDVFSEGRKSCDGFSNLKSNNYLMYAQAALYAREQGLDDCLVLNAAGRVADSTIANVFYIKNGVCHTPPLSEGGVAGVMRRYLLEALPGAGYAVREESVSVENLLAADEVFLTNALRGIYWVRSLGSHTYGCQVAAALYERFIKIL